MFLFHFGLKQTNALNSTFPSLCNNCGDRTKKRTRQQTMDREKDEEALIFFSVYRWQNKTEEQRDSDWEAGQKSQLIGDRSLCEETNERVRLKKKKNKIFH